MTTYEIETRTLTVESTTVSVAEIGPWLGKAFTEVASYLARYLARKGAEPAERRGLFRVSQ